MPLGAAFLQLQHWKNRYVLDTEKGCSAIVDYLAEQQVSHCTILQRHACEGDWSNF